MHASTFLLGASVIAAATGFAYRAHVHVERPSATAPSGRFLISPGLKPEYSDAEALEPGRPCWALFRLEPGARLTGIACAAIAPHFESGPLVEKSANVVYLQRKGGLDLTRYLEQVRPSGRRCLLYALWVECDGTLEWRTGWSRFQASDLETRGLEIRAPARHRACIEVHTRGGQPVPGAMLSFDEGGRAPGSLRRYGHTDENGRLIVSGLEERHDWLVSLIEGVGPDVRRQSATLRVGGGEVRFTVGLAGRWTFVRHRVRPPGLGCPIGIDRLEGVDAPPRVWPVSHWVPPGRWPDSALYLMYPEGSRVPHQVRLHIRGFPEPLRFDPRSKDTLLQCRLESDSD